MGVGWAGGLPRHCRALGAGRSQEPEVQILHLPRLGTQHIPGGLLWTQACLRLQGKMVRCEQEFLQRTRSDGSVHCRAPNIHMEGTTGPGRQLPGPCTFQRCCDPEEQPGRPVFGAWHLVGGSCPESGLGQSRLLKGQKRYPRCECQFPTRNAPKDFQRELPGAAGLRGRTPREPRAALPDAAARWRSELTLAAQGRRPRGWGRRACAPPARVSRGLGSLCAPPGPSRKKKDPAKPGPLGPRVAPVAAAAKHIP